VLCDRRRCRGACLSVDYVVAVLFPNDVVNLTHFSAVDFDDGHVEVRVMKEEALEFGAILLMDEKRERD
jgi:hypothetical protein